MPRYANFAEFADTLRTDFGALSEYEFCKRAGISESIYSQWRKREVQSPNYETVRKIEAAFGIHVHYTEDGEVNGYTRSEAGPGVAYPDRLEDAMETYLFDKTMSQSRDAFRLAYEKFRLRLRMADLAAHQEKLEALDDLRRAGRPPGFDYK